MTTRSICNHSDVIFYKNYLYSVHLRLLFREVGKETRACRYKKFDSLFRVRLKAVERHVLLMSTEEENSH